MYFKQYLSIIISKPHPSNTCVINLK